MTDRTSVLFERPYKGPDAITGYTMSEFIEFVDSDGVTASDFAKAAAIRICRSYGIRGICDPGYIANVIQSSFDRWLAAAPDLLYELEQACLSLDELAKEYIEGIGHNATARGVREQTRRARAAIEKARKEG